MPTYDLYGFPFSDLEAVRQQVEAALAIRFEPHENSFIGEYYLYGKRYEKGNILLKMNYDPEDDDILYSEFADFPVLLEANDPDKPDGLRQELEAKLQGCKLLRRKQL